MTEARTHDLHDCEKLAFEGWNEEDTYLERVTVSDQDEAVRLLAADTYIPAEDLNPQRIFLRWETCPPGEPFTYDGYEYEGGWSECDANHPDAVPYWKEGP